MIYRLPVSAGINVSDSNQKSLNLNSLQALPMRDCTGIEYNGVISGWSAKFGDYQEEIEEIGGAPTKIKVSPKAVFFNGRKNTVKYDDILFPSNTCELKSNEETVDYKFEVTTAMTSKERDFFPVGVVDVVDGNTLLKINPGKTKLIVEYTDADGALHSLEKEVEGIVFARFCFDFTGSSLIQTVAVVTDSYLYVYEVDLGQKEISENPLVSIALSDSDFTNDFISLYVSYMGDIYRSGDKVLFVGRNDSRGVGQSEGIHIAQSSGSCVFKNGGSAVFPGSTYTDLIIYSPYFDDDEKMLYVNGVYRNGEQYFINLMKSDISGNVSVVWTSAAMTKEEIETINQWCGCWSEFEYYYNHYRYYRSGSTMTSRPAGIDGISELTGRTENGLFVSTINGIPGFIEKGDLLIGGLTEEISTAFPKSADYLYHLSGRVIRFVDRKADALVDSSLINRGGTLSRAVSKIKNGIVKIATDRQPIFFDFENRRPIYGCLGYTGAIKADGISAEEAVDEKYKVTSYAALMTNEISNTTWENKQTLIHDDVAVGKVKVSRRLAAFKTAEEELPKTEPVFSFYCAVDVDVEKNIRYGNMAYLYDYSENKIKIDRNKVGTYYGDSVGYNQMPGLPVWATIREDNPRVADGGNVVFFCATNPSIKERGRGIVGYVNYYMESYFDEIDGYFFIGGKHFIIQNEAISEIVIGVNGVLSSVVRYIENVKFVFLGQAQSEAYFLSNADKRLYRYTGYYQMTEAADFSNIEQFSRGKYYPTINGFFFFPVEDLRFIYFYRGGNMTRFVAPGYDFTGKEIDRGAYISDIQEDSSLSFHVYNVNFYEEEGWNPFSPCYLDYAFSKDPGYKQQAFSLETNYIGVPYTELQVKSLALTFYVTLEAADEVTVLFRYKWRYAESAGSEEAEFVIRYDETEIDPAGRRFVRFRFIPRTQKVVDFALGLSLPSLNKDVSLLSVEFAGVEVEADAKEKPLIGELWSR